MAPLPTTGQRSAGGHRYPFADGFVLICCAMLRGLMLFCGVCRFASKPGQLRGPWSAWNELERRGSSPAMVRIVPEEFSKRCRGQQPAACGSPMQIVAGALHYFAVHFGDPILIPELARLLGISDDCLDFSFDQVRGMTPAQALQEHRLNRLFASLSDQPRQGLGHAIRACGLGQTSGVVNLFEQTFGIEMPLFLLTCRRAAEDRRFRGDHPDRQALVLPSP